MAVHVCNERVAHNGSCTAVSARSAGMCSQLAGDHRLNSIDAIAPSFLRRGQASYYASKATTRVVDAAQIWGRRDRGVNGAGCEVLEVVSDQQPGKPRRNGTEISQPRKAAQLCSRWYTYTYRPKHRVLGLYAVAGGAQYSSLSSQSSSRVTYSRDIYISYEGQRCKSDGRERACVRGCTQSPSHRSTASLSARKVDKTGWSRSSCVIVT